VLAASIIRTMMEEANTSETFVNFYRITRLNNPEDSHLQVKIKLKVQVGLRKHDSCGTKPA
jgi:LEA14-like dessication related protein